MPERSQFDDRAPIDVSRLHPSLQEKLVSADNALGLLELGAIHARNTFRDLVRSDDLAVNAALLANLTGTLAECVKFAEALHGDFAAFNEAQRDG
jgi:hypothetical protein